ncbi:Phosphatidate cytidylyltransferase, partial [Dysosmobacter welbionis]
EEMPQVIPIRQHMPPQLRVGHAVGKNVQPAVLHPPNVGGEGFLPGNHGGHTPTDGQPLLMELGLVVRHDAHRAIRMEVPGDLGQLKAEQRQLLHGEGEEVLIVRLEVDLPAHLQHLAVQPQEVAVGQAALGVAVAGPGIAEVDIDPVCLSRGKEQGQLVSIGVDEEHVGEPLGRAPLHGHDHGVRHPLHGDEQHVRLRRRCAGGEAALAAAQLQPQLPGLGHQLPPLARHGVGLPDQAVAAALHPGDQILFLSHPHVSTSSWVGSRSDFRKTPPGSPPYIQNAIVPYRPGAVNGG